MMHIITAPSGTASAVFAFVPDGAESSAIQGGPAPVASCEYRRRGTDGLFAGAHGPATSRSLKDQRPIEAGASPWCGESCAARWYDWRVKYPALLRSRPRRAVGW